MLVVTMKEDSQNGGLATILDVRAAPTIPDLTINVLQLPLVVAVRLDPTPPPVASPTSHAKGRAVRPWPSSSSSLLFSSPSRPRVPLVSVSLWRSS